MDRRNISFLCTQKLNQHQPRAQRSESQTEILGAKIQTANIREFRGKSM